MTNEQFLLHTQQATLRRTEILKKKEKEYSNGRDRLEQFHRAASAQNILPTEALIGMATKHFTSITDLCKDPSNHTFRQWHEKLDDLRNYCDLLDALITDVKE